jgi:enoyl-CoA hydratase
MMTGTSTWSTGLGQHPDHLGADPATGGWSPHSTPIRASPKGHYDGETRGYLRYAKAWRDVPKPSIAAVQGTCIAAGLMLCWPCELIVAADNAELVDPVLFMGRYGIEYHAHTWELGPRRAKEMLFTDGPVTAQQAERFGMVNHVVPLEELVPATKALARRIAPADPFALRMAKRAVNHTLGLQGFGAAIDACFDMHHFGHARARVMTSGDPSLTGLASTQKQNR